MSWKIISLFLMRTNHLIEASCPTIGEHLRANEEPQISLQDIPLSWGMSLWLVCLSGLYYINTMLLLLDVEGLLLIFLQRWLSVG